MELVFLKKHSFTLMSQLTDLSMVDYPERKARFELFYGLLSFKYKPYLPNNKLYF